MQYFVVHIRSEYKVAEWVSRLEENFVQQKNLEPDNIEEDNIRCILFTSLEFCEEDIPEELVNGTSF